MNNCPTGVATQNPNRAKALVVKDKIERVANFHNATIKSFLDMMGAMGITHPDELKPEMIYHRLSEGKSIHYGKVFDFIEPGNLLTNTIHQSYQADWSKSSEQHF
jgi:hypothetical protein